MIREAKNTDNRPRVLTIFVLCVALLAGTALGALAGEVSIFGPEKFVRSKGQPDTITNSFRIPAGVTQCQFVVTGEDGGPFAANNVSVLINDVELVNAKDLREKSEQQRPLILKGENTLVVTLKGKPGDAVIVTITGEVPDPPEPPRPVYPEPLPPEPPRPVFYGPSDM